MTAGLGSRTEGKPGATSLVGLVKSPPAKTCVGGAVLPASVIATAVAWAFLRP